MRDHDRFVRRFVVAMLPLLVLVFGLLLEPANAQTKTEKQTLTKEQRKQIKALVVAFKRAKKDPGARQQAFSDLLDFEAAGVKALEPVIDRMLASEVKSYLRLFEKAAVGASKGKKIDVEEVSGLRAKVLKLKALPGLTKEQILQDGDPSIDRLRELLVVPRSAVLENERLQSARDDLKPVGEYWDQLQVKKQTLATAEAGKDSKSAGKDLQIQTFEHVLTGKEETIVQLAMPMSPQNRAVLATNQQIADKVGKEEVVCVDACNLIRNLLGLNVLQIDVKMCLAARDHSTDMKTLKFFAHESPVPGKKQPWDRAKNFGTTASNENIFVGRRTGEAANLAWFHSPGHHKNMLIETHKRIGVGQNEKHWTQLFGR